MNSVFNAFVSNRISLVSGLISLVGICIVLSINHDIAVHYQTTDGKGRALFGLILLAYSYRYYTAGLGILALLVAMFGKKMGENRAAVFMALTLSLISVVAAFVDFWRLWV